MQIIYQHGKAVSRSKNLAGVRRYAGKNVASIVYLNRAKHGSAILCVVFENGATFETRFASFVVLKGFIRRWRSVYGAELQIDNEVRGEVNSGNEVLK